MSEAAIITAILSGSLVSIIACITVAVNIEEIARAGRATFDWWKKRKDDL